MFLIYKGERDSFGVLKQENITAKSYLYNAFSKIFDNFSVKLRNKLILWKNVNFFEKTQNLQQKILLSFENINALFTYNTNDILETREFRGKREILQKIFRNYQLKTFLALEAWKNVKKNTKIHKERTKKAYGISKMNEFSIKFQNRELSEILKKFIIFVKNKKSIILLFSIIKETHSVKIAETFKKWKEFEVKRVSEYEKPTSLMKIMKIFKKISYFELRKTMQNFEKARISGNSFKQNSARNLLNIFSDKRREKFNHWKTLSKNMKNILLIRKIMHCFETCNEIYTSNLHKLLLENVNIDRKKEKIIRVFLTNCRKNIREAFLIWLGNTEILRVEDERFIERKITAVNVIENLLKNREINEKTRILLKFHRNLNKNEEIVKFHGIFVKFIDYNILYTFKKWRFLQNIRESQKFDASLYKEKGIFLEKRIENLVFKEISLIFQDFKSQKVFGNEIKKNQLSLFAEKTKQKIQGSISHWREIHRHHHNNFLIKALIYSFEILQNSVNKGISELFEKNEEFELKRQFLVKFMDIHIKNRLRHGFSRWFQGISKLNDKKEVNIMKRRFFIEKIEKLLKSLIEIRNRDVFQKILENSKKWKIFKKFIFSTMRKIRDNLVFSMKKLKKNIENDEKSPNLNNLYDLLLKKTLNTLNSSFYALHDNFKDKAENLKISSISRILSNITDMRNKGFHQWNLYSRNQRNSKIYEKTVFFYEICNDIFSNNVKLLYKKPKNDEKFFCLNRSIQRLLHKNLKNIYFSLKSSNFAAETLKNRLMGEFIKGKQTHIREYIRHWRKMKSVKKYREFLKFIEIYRNSDFSQKTKILSRFYRNSTQKRQSSHSLIKLVGDIENKLKKMGFTILKKHLKINDKAVIPLNNLAKTGDSMIKRLNFSIFHKISRYAERKSDQNSKNLKKLLFLMLFSKFDSLLRFAYERIKHQAEIELVKTYINSLWKWKMSNMESRYYLLMNKNIKKTLALSNITNASEALLSKTKRNALEKIDKNSAFLKNTLKSILHNAELYLFYQKYLAILIWRIKALESSKQALLSQNLQYFTGSRIISFLNKKRSKELSHFFKKWLFEKNKAKIAFKLFSKSLKNKQKEAFFIWKHKTFSNKDKYRGMQIYIALENYEKNLKKLCFSRSLSLIMQSCICHAKSTCYKFRRLKISGY